MSLFWTIAIGIVCLVLQGFFSGTEIAMVSADRVWLKGMVAKGSSRAKLTMWWISHPAKLFSTTLIGTNLSLVMLSTIITIYIIQNYGEAYGAFAILLSPITLIIGETIPKSLFQHHANQIVLRVVHVLTFFSTLMYPGVWIFSQITNLFFGGVRQQTGTDLPMLREELELMIASSSHPKSDVRPIERRLIEKILKLGEKRVRHVQVPTTEMVAIPASMTVESAQRVLEMSDYSRVPVFDERPYQFMGILHDVDLMDVDPTWQIHDLIHPAQFVPEEMHLNDLFLSFREKHEEMALVVDEFGGVSGLVTLADIYSEVVGEIDDETDLSHQHFQVLGKNYYMVSGRMPVAEANEDLNLKIPVEDYSTVAGYLLWHFGRFPEVGEEITIGLWHYIIRSMSPRAILEVEVKMAQDL